MSETAKKSFFSDLWDRRFFQFFATFIAASWGMIQFAEWGVKRYGFDSSWVDRLVIILLILLPSVICLIYLHGRVGDDGWKKFEKILYPANIVVALLAASFLISSGTQDTTAKVEITGEEGEVIIRDVPKAEFSKRLVIFPFENDNGTDPTWKGIGSAILLDLELEQDMRITAISPTSISDEYGNNNYGIYDAIPFSTKRNIAEKKYSDFFVAGKYLNDQGSKLEVNVYETLTGNEIGNEILESENPIYMTEKISSFVASKIKLAPVEGREIMVDLPASNLITADTAAFREYIQGIVSLEKDGANIKASIAHLEKSIEIDPTCAECHIYLANLQMANSIDPQAELKEAMKYVSNISERQQLALKTRSYLLRQEMDKGIKLLENWRKLYPQDSKPVNILVDIFRSTLRTKEAMLVCEQAMEDGHEGTIYLTYANLLVADKEWDKAEEYLVKYNNAYPKQSESNTLLADTYNAQGKFNKARSLLEELSLMNPNNLAYEIKIASILSKEAKFNEAMALLNSKLKDANKYQDTVSIYNAQMEILGRQGKVTAYYDKKRDMKNVFLKHNPPIAFLQSEYTTSGYYQMIEEYDSIIYNIRNLENELGPPQRLFIKKLNDFIIDLFTKNVATVDSTYEAVKPILLQSGGENMEYMYDGELAFMKEDYQGTIDSYDKYIDNGGLIDVVSYNYYKAFEHTGEYDKGIEAITYRMTSDPLSPFNMIAKARLLAKKGSNKEALKLVNRSLEILKDAHPNFETYKDATRLKSELTK